MGRKLMINGDGLSFLLLSVIKASLFSTDQGGR